MSNQMETVGQWETIAASELPNHQMVLDGGQLAAHWRRCSLTADFWSRYLALAVPVDAAQTRIPRAAMTDILSYLLNELFENCAKFSAGPHLVVYYQTWLRDEETVIQLTNHIRPGAQAPFQAIIQEILEGDPDELYFQRLEASVELNLSGSGLGYLTLIKDYGISFGFRFRRVQDESVAVDVQAHVATNH